jgi:hypothetical protein
MNLHIYTGYQWRPMTDEEILIMSPENVVPIKPKHPEAGDIYIEQEAPNDGI